MQMLTLLAVLGVARGLQAPQCKTAQRLQTRRYVATVQETRTCSCRFCGAAFQSKNALFRHLRESDACSAAAAAEDPRAPAAIAERKLHVATYLVGYGAGKGADAEAALTSLCSASSVTRATAVALVTDDALQSDASAASASAPLPAP